MDRATTAVLARLRRGPANLDVQHRARWGDRTPEERFWAKVDKPIDEGHLNECWVWTGSRHAFGYGYLNVAGKVETAHRISWELHHGPIPKGMSVLHRCDNPPCVRLDHLFLGTQGDNIRDAFRKGRMVVKPGRTGEACGKAKLTWDQVASICRRCLAVRTPRTLCHGCAGRFGGRLTVEMLRRWGLAGGIK